MNKVPLSIGIGAIVLAALAILLNWDALPEQVPMHWNAEGVVDDTGPKWQLWLLGPGLMSFILSLNWLLPWMSPPKFTLEESRRTLAYLLTVIEIVLGFFFALALLSALDHAVPMKSAAWIAAFLALILLGSPMGKLRRNFYVGVRTPWTLADEQVWYQTHRLTGWLMVGSGFLGLAALMLDQTTPVLVTLALAWAAASVLYSFYLSKRQEA